MAGRLGLEPRYRRTDCTTLTVSPLTISVSASELVVPLGFEPRRRSNQERGLHIIV